MTKKAQGRTTPTKEMDSVDKTHARVQDYFTFKIHALSREHARGVKQVLEDQFDLSLIEWRVMSWIATSQVDTVREISRLSYLAKSQISHGLNLLVRRRLAVSKSDPADKRNRVFALTENGQKIFARVTRWHRARQRELIGALEPEEFATMMRSLDKLLVRFRADRDMDDGKSARKSPSTRHGRSGKPVR